jgi:hypothetical protein
MCNFFSFCTQPSANSDFYYFDWKQRLEMKHNGADSHSHICAHYKLDEDKCNKWEYNPLTKELTLDMQNDPKDDTKRAKRWVEKLDWKAIVEPLIIKPIVNPFELPAVERVTDEQIDWLKSWASVWNSVRNSVGNSVRNSVGNSVWDPVRNSVEDVVWASVWEVVWASVWDAVWDAVRVSVWAYFSSFFAIEYKFDFSSAVKLWDDGLVPSFNGTTWRLHTGKDAHVVYEWKPEEVK